MAVRLALWYAQITILHLTLSGWMVHFRSCTVHGGSLPIIRLTILPAGLSIGSVELWYVVAHHGLWVRIICSPPPHYYYYVAHTP